MLDLPIPKGTDQYSRAPNNEELQRIVQRVELATLMRSLPRFRIDELVGWVRYEESQGVVDHLLVAALRPAFTAAHVDPVSALRYE